MISKEVFVKTIEQLKRFNQIESNIQEASKELDFFSFAFPEYEDLVINILTEVCDDKSEWIEYWAFELDYGKEYYKGTVTENDKPVDISTPEKLYELVAKNYYNQLAEKNNFSF
ncbi:MAG: hypothetical protein WCO84_01045 [bacterium]